MLVAKYCGCFFVVASFVFCDDNDDDGEDDGVVIFFFLAWFRFSLSTVRSFSTAGTDENMVQPPPPEIVSLLKLSCTVNGLLDDAEYQSNGDA